jgi:hypothetical protein
MHKHTPQNTECFNWQLPMEVIYVRTVCGVHEHSWYLRAITKTQLSERRHMGNSVMQVPQNTGNACSTWSLGDYKSLVYYCHLTHFCVLFTSLYTFQIKIRYVFWRLYITECGVLFWKAWKMEFKLSHNLLQDMNSICTFKTIPSSAQVSESFADILQAQAKTLN